ncbi:MAG TPA: metal-dependent transcriptional regulator [Miltoncostaeaceae bacterium]|nr:metal-dependent transcriptional regulator [Miltoncostaeaceae bacterium]
MAQGHSTDEYLETIYFLAFPIGEYGPVVRDSPALAARVAEMLGVSAPSAGEMLKRLEADGLIARGSRKEALLTERGRAEAERVVRRHRIIERMLTDFMGYTPAESHEHADRLGEAFTDEMVERIADRLGHPDRCPHGWPVDPSAEQAENRELQPLSDLPAESDARIVRLAEHDGSLLAWFYDQGLVPGVEVRVERIEPAADQLTLTVDGERRPVSHRAAAGLFVRRLAPAGVV